MKTSNLIKFRGAVYRRVIANPFGNVNPKIIVINPTTTTPEIKEQVKTCVLAQEPFILGRYLLMLEGTNWMVHDTLSSNRNLDGISQGAEKVRPHDVGAVASLIVKAWLRGEWEQ